MAACKRHHAVSRGYVFERTVERLVGHLFTVAASGFRVSGFGLGGRGRVCPHTHTHTHTSLGIQYLEGCQTLIFLYFQGVSAHVAEPSQQLHGSASHACMHKYARACMHARYSRYTHTQAGGARASAGWEQGWRAGCTRGPLLAAQMQLGSRQPQHGARPRPPSVGACDHLHFINDGHVHVPVHVHHFYVCIYALQRVIPCFLLLFRCCCC